MGHKEIEMKKRIALGFVLLLLVSTAWAAGPNAVRKQTEASMLVTGTIEVGSNGEVRSHTLDQREKLPAEVATFIDRNVVEWAFTPYLHEGKPAILHNKMSILMRAQRLESGGFRMFVAAVDFAPLKQASESGTGFSAINMDPPRYPVPAARDGAVGTAYLLLKINRSGKVDDALVEQVNLRVVADESQMQRWRDMFAKSSLEAAMKWAFVPPTTGDAADDPYWTVRVPVDYAMEWQSKPRYGRWVAYIPGPRQENPWPTDESPGFAPDALAAGDIRLAGKGGLELLTPLQTN
jgi:TonB family protein